MQEETMGVQIDHVGRIYEAAKTAAASGDSKGAMDGLQELRNIACEFIQNAYKLNSENDRLKKALSVCVANIENSNTAPVEPDNWLLFLKRQFLP